MKEEQLALDIELRDDATFESFYVGRNQEAYLAALEIANQGKGIANHKTHFVYLFGKRGVGRSHLLQAACHHARRMGTSAIYIPLEQINELSAHYMRGLENINLICIDDIQLMMGKEDWEEAFFHLFNQIQQQKSYLLVGADASPLYINIQLPDLKSRLSLGVAYHLEELEDDQKIEALMMRAHARGLELSRNVGQFLLSHCPRNMTKLFSTLEILDKASLMQQRRLTVPFIKEVLSL